jgi:hypothetical protein
MIPYPRLCLATTPPSQNRNPGREPPQGLTGGPAPAGLPPPVTRSTPSAPHPLARGPMLTAPSPRHSLLAGLVGRLPARAPTLGWAEIPLAQLAKKSLSFSFPFFFSYYIYTYV